MINRLIYLLIIFICSCTTNKSQPLGKPTRYEVTKTFFNRCKHQGIKPTGGNKMIIGTIIEPLFNTDSTFLYQTNQISKNIKAFTEEKNFNIQIGIGTSKKTELLYIQNEYQPLWYNLELRNQGVNFLNSSKNHGLIPNDYGLNKIESLIKKIDNDTIFDAQTNATLDITFTSGMLLFCHHLQYGKVNPKSLSKVWNYTREDSNYEKDTIILNLIKNGKLSDIETIISCQTELYISLKKELSKFREIENRYNLKLPTYPNIILKEGDSSKQVLTLKKYLIGINYLSKDNVNNAFDAEVTKSIKLFQETRGLIPDGIPGKRTYDFMGWTPQKYIDVIRINMERCRWYQNLNLFNESYLVVNIPEYKIRLFKNREELFQSKVIVGKVKNKTPVFQSEIEYLVFNPCWTVPNSIATKKMLPKIQKDSSYLDRNNMFIGKNGIEQNADSIDFNNYSENDFPFKIYQRSCSSNSLGKVKFMFPNKYQVFLHDTPNKSLFNKEFRALSSGCVRIQNPLELAQIILKDVDSNNTPTSSYLAKNYPLIVTLNKRIDMNITYLTCAYNNNTIYFFNDVYSRDYKVLKELDVSN